MANSTNLDVQMDDSFSLSPDNTWTQMDVDVDFDMYLQGDLGMDDATMGDLSVDYSNNNNQIIDPNLLDNQFLNIFRNPQPQDFVPGGIAILQQDLFNQGDSFPFPPQENVSSGVEQPAMISKDPSLQKSKPKAASIKSAKNQNTFPVLQKVKRKRISKKKKRTPEEEEEKRKKFLSRNRVAAAKCREKKKEQTGTLQERHDAMSLANSILREDYDTVLAEVKMLRAIAAAHGEVPQHCNPSIMTKESQEAAGRLISKCIDQGDYTGHSDTTVDMAVGQHLNCFQGQAFMPQQVPQIPSRQISENQENYDLSLQISHHISRQNSSNSHHVPVVQQNIPGVQHPSIGHNGFVAPSMHRSHSWPGMNAGQPNPPQPSHHGLPIMESVPGDLVPSRTPLPVCRNESFDPNYQPVSQVGWPVDVREPCRVPVARPFSAPPPNARLGQQFFAPPSLSANGSNLVHGDLADRMQRGGSGDSHGSGQSSRHDSGISNMGSPPKKSKVQTPPRDEGFEGSHQHDKFGNLKIVTPPPQVYEPMMLRPQWRGLHQQQKLGDSLSDLSDPSVWIKRQSS